MADKKIICRTTRAHYEKYSNLKRRLGITFAVKDRLASDVGTFGNKETLTRLFKEDKNLNQFGLPRFYAFHSTYNSIYCSVVPKEERGGGGLSYVEVASLIKHCLIFEVIGAEVEFEDED